MTTVSTTSSNTATAATLRAIASELSAQFLEREDVIQGMLIALVAHQHVLLVGAPGTAKSALARAVAGRVEGGDHFEVLLTKFTTPEEVFGPISLSGLQADRYARILDGRLASAHTAMIDEVGKASSAILNALLGVMADRVYHNDGAVVACPLTSLVGASNELPDGDELAALYDRFLLRYEVTPLSDSAFTQLLSLTPAAATSTTISLAELEALHAAMPTVSLPTTVIEVLAKLRAELRHKGFEVSDRRWRTALTLLRASALYHGRALVGEDDLELLAHVLWARPDDRTAIAQAVAMVGNPLKAKATELADRAVAIHEDAAKSFTAADQDLVQKAAMQANAKLKGILTELQRLIDTHKGQDVSRLEAAIEKVKALNADVVRRGFGL